MKKNILVVMSLLLFAGCAQKSVSEKKVEFSEKSKKEEKPLVEPTPVPSIVVSPKDLQKHDKMTKALEAYILKGDKTSFAALCKDSHFDCFVDNKAYPKNKKKQTRKVPPYASGSKMGLQGENRIHVRYDFYP
ncbi:hypothetical protein [Bdellovibrio sp.]|uniref:hypothetical protein n=1 Tax=Bdellovibrio sp. TaxID=28201 RepID=UPI0039E5BB16